jgi:hypothetical protein
MRAKSTSRANLVFAITQSVFGLSAKVGRNGLRIAPAAPSQQSRTKRRNSRIRRHANQ